MVPYANFLYFGVLLFPTLISLAVGFVRILKRAWILIATLLMLVLQYSNVLTITPNVQVYEIWLVLAYAAYEAVVLYGYAAIRARMNHRAIF